jgi:hypothetical protein
LFTKTESSLRKLHALGKYRVFYLWESEYESKTEEQLVWSMCREFVDVLEWQ